MSEANIIIGTANIIVALVVIALAIPLLRGRVEMNWWYGVRFQKSFESDELWYTINRYGARRVIYWSVVLLLIGVACFFVTIPNLFWELVLALASLLYIIPAVESYQYARSL